MTPLSLTARTPRAALIACAAAAALAPAQAHDAAEHGSTFGMPGLKADVTRTVRVSMTDAMRFTPSHVVVHEGQTLRFVVRNEGRLRHEFVLGSDAGLAAHAEMMKLHPDMHHSDPNMVTLEGGQTSEVIWRFTTDGSVGFACLQPGHFDAGMRGQVDVRGAHGPAAAGGKSSPPLP
ncbi:MAG TPA: cupredoxin family protein [Burkholderiaceae bacterium]